MKFNNLTSVIFQFSICSIDNFKMKIAVQMCMVWKWWWPEGQGDESFIYNTEWVSGWICEVDSVEMISSCIKMCNYCEYVWERLCVCVRVMYITNSK